MCYNPQIKAFNHQIASVYALDLIIYVLVTLEN